MTKKTKYHPISKKAKFNLRPSDKTLFGLIQLGFIDKRDYKVKPNMNLSAFYNMMMEHYLEFKGILNLKDYHKWLTSKENQKIEKCNEKIREYQKANEQVDLVIEDRKRRKKIKK